MAYHHTPVMLAQVIDLLACEPGQTVVDGTLGGSGHAAAVLKRIDPDGCLVGIDQDADAIRHAEAVLRAEGSRIHLIHGDYRDIPHILSRRHIGPADGILLDLGVSYHQIEHSGRGFSFNKDEPLDMRMNPETGMRAEVLINELEEAQLADMFHRLGEEKLSRRIAGRIVAARKRRPIHTSRQLADVVAAAVPRSRQRPAFHPATRVFMALRIAVNQELEKLAAFLDADFDYLRPGGRLCILSFHSLEDRIVKQRFNKLAGACTCPPGLPVCACGPKRILRVLTPKALRPTAEEIHANPLARSAVLRAAEKWA